MTSDTPPDPAWAVDLDRPLPWRSHSETVVFDNAWMRLTRHAATAPTGVSADYAVMRPRNLAVGVLPVHDDGTVTLVGQHRFTLGRFSWEMPEGGAPFDEDPLAGARRELAEETGLTAEHWIEAMRLDLSNSITDERAVTWIAWGLTGGKTAPDPTEALVRARPHFLDLLDEIGRGAVRDALTVATAFRAYHMAREGALPTSLARVLLNRL